MRDRPPGCVRYRHERWSSVRSGVATDMLRFATFHPDYQPDPGLKTRISILLQPSILCLMIYRFGHSLHVRGWRRLARGLASLNLFLFKANIPADSCIGPACFVGHCPGTSFVGTAGRNLTLFSLAVCCPAAGGPGTGAEGGPRLGDGVTVGGHATIVGSISVGDDVQVAAQSALSRDCPERTVVFSRYLRPAVRPRAAAGPQSSNAL